MLIGLASLKSFASPCPSLSTSNLICGGNAGGIPSSKEGKLSLIDTAEGSGSVSGGMDGEPLSPFSFFGADLSFLFRFVLRTLVGFFGGFTSSTSEHSDQSTENG